MATITKLTPKSMLHAEIARLSAENERLSAEIHSLDEYRDADRRRAQEYERQISDLRHRLGKLALVRIDARRAARGPWAQFVLWVAGMRDVVNQMLEQGDDGS